MSNTFNKVAPLPLRAVVGFGFVYHGVGKLFSAEGHQSFVGMLQNIGVPAAEFTAWLVGALEMAGGLALIAGAFVTVASALLGVNMLVAIATVHLPHGFSFINVVAVADGAPQFGMPGYEVPLLYIAGLAALVAAGPSFLSVDEFRSAASTERSA